MLARCNRFHGYGSLRHVYQRGQTARGGYMSIKLAENPRRKTYRAAVVVSRKVSKSAVVRNRIRRRLYEQLRTLLPVEGGRDIVVLIYSDEVARMEAGQLTSDIERLFEHLQR